MTNIATWLAHLQFFTGLGFLLVFLLIELALAWVLFAFRLATHLSGRPEWVAAYRFWVRVFALASILVLASAIPIILQSASQWPGLPGKVDDVVGPLLLVMTVAGLIFRSCFLGAMLFGQPKLSAWVHTAMVFMTALGATLTAWLGCVLLGWFIHPTGGVWVDGRYTVESWRQLLGNPQGGWLFGLLAAMSMLAAGSLMLGVSAWQSLRHVIRAGEAVALRTGLLMGGVGWLLVLGLLMGYAQASVTHLPARAAAIMGYWHGAEPAKLVMFAWPDARMGQNRAAVQVDGGERWLARDENGALLGLDRFSGMTPPVALVFWSARLLLLMLLLMGGLFAAAAWYVWRRGTDLRAAPEVWRRLWAGCTYVGCLAALAGLTCLLSGQAPYAVQGRITLSEVAGSRSLAESLFGVLLYGGVYGVLALGFVRLVRHTAQYGVVPVARHRGRA